MTSERWREDDKILDQLLVQAATFVLVCDQAERIKSLPEPRYVTLVIRNFQVISDTKSEFDYEIWPYSVRDYARAVRGARGRQRFIDAAQDKLALDEPTTALEGQVCRFNFEGVGSIAFMRTRGVLRVTVNEEGSPELPYWGIIHDDDMLFAVWAGEGQSFYASTFDNGIDRIVFYIVRGSHQPDGKFERGDNGDRLHFMIAANGDVATTRELEFHRSTTGRQLYQSFRCAELGEKD